MRGSSVRDTVIPACKDHAARGTEFSNPLPAAPSCAITTGTMSAGSVLSALSAVAPAQDYPSKPIRLIIGFPPGGSNDIVARQLAPRLSDALATQVVVENRPGANATIATELVARSAPDGYTLTLASASPLAISPHTYSKIGYDTLRDFAGITTVAMTPELVAVHPALPVRSLKELVALARAQPGSSISPPPATADCRISPSSSSRRSQE